MGMKACKCRRPHLHTGSATWGEGLVEAEKLAKEAERETAKVERGPGAKVMEGVVKY